MGWKLRWLGTILVLQVFFLWAFVAQAYPGVKFKVRPKISAGWRVDTNYYGAEKVEREVYTYTVSPGFELGIKTPKSSLGLNYALEANFYNDKDPVPPGEKPTDEDNYVGHTLVLTGRHRLTRRILVGLDDSFYFTRDPAQSDALSNSIKREKYFINRITPMIYYNFDPRFSLGLRYRNTKIDYRPGDEEDAKEIRGIIDLVYNMGRKATFDLEYQHWKRHYDQESSDYSSDQIRLILKKKLRFFSFTAGAGYHKRDFVDADVKDMSVFTYFITMEGSGTLANRRSRISLNITQNLNDQGTGDQYYKATRLTVTAEHDFTKKLTGSMSGYYQISDYEGTYGLSEGGSIKERKDNTYDVSGMVSYRFARWMTFSLSAGYTSRDSNLAGLDYDNTYCVVNIGFAYGPGKR